MGTNTSTVNKNYRRNYTRKPVLVLLEKNVSSKFLLVEGKSDEFYEQLLPNDIKIFPVIDTKEYIEKLLPSVSYSSKEYVKAIVEKQLF